MRSLIPAVSILSALLSVGAVAQDRDGDWGKGQIKHVLLISIDGMHAVDYKNCALYSVPSAASPRCSP